jgi:hypothetical protein
MGKTQPNAQRSGKKSKATQRKMMIGQVNKQVATPSPAYNFNCTQCNLESKLEMILVKEWSCNVFEIFSLKQSTLLLPNYSKGGTLVQSPVEDIITLISNTLQKGVALTYLHILLPTRKCENPTKIWKL